MSMDVQRQIRENTLELNEFLKDLKGWEQAVKEKEKIIQGQGAPNDKNPAGAPRSQLPPNSEGKRKEAQDTRSDKPAVTKIPNKVAGSPDAKVKKQDTAASHTHDKFRDKWDKFDVDAALKEIDKESDDEDDRPLKKAPKRDVPPPRGAALKTGSDRWSGGQREAAPVSHSLPSGQILGQRVDPMADQFTGSFGFNDSPPDAASEKDLGNEYFKEGKYVRAIDCYSRSIALQPTAVAYANRAMAAIKIKRFEDAEFDCSEAILLDDRYTKAYGRRGTARRELKKYLLAVEDFEFALRLEPENKELKKQLTDTDELYQKEGGQVRPSNGGVPLIVKGDRIPPKQQPVGKSLATVGDDSRKLSVPSKVASTNIGPKSNPKELLPDAASLSIRSKDQEHFSDTTVDSKSKERSSDADSWGAKSRSKEHFPETTMALNMLASPELPTDSGLLKIPKNSTPGVAQKQVRGRDKKQAELAAATQAAAARAAASAMAAVSRNIVAPKSSYEFEIMWKGFAGNQGSQARLLKVTDPVSLPRIFKDSMSAPLLVEIIQSLELLFPDDAKLAVQILGNLTKVGRFNMTVMFFTAKDKSGLGQLWERVFMNSPDGLRTQLQLLRTTYRLV